MVTLTSDVLLTPNVSGESVNRGASPMTGSMTTHADHKYSITIHSDDLAVINCVRALSKYSQKTGNNTLAYGNTKDRDWKKNGHEVTFHFSDPQFRDGFVSQLKRLLPQPLWSEVSRRDNDPARSAS